MSLLARLQAEGIQISALPGGRLAVSPRSRVSPELADAIREHRDELLAMLTRREQALSMLVDRDRAYLVTDGDPVIVTVAVRGAGVADFEIPRDRWDPFLFLRFLEGRTQ